MNGMIKFWLVDMYDENIEDAKGTIRNEEMWAKGSPSKEEEQMHLDNIAVLQDYITVLEELKENVETM